MDFHCEINFQTVNDTNINRIFQDIYMCINFGLNLDRGNLKSKINISKESGIYKQSDETFQICMFEWRSPMLFQCFPSRVFINLYRCFEASSKWSLLREKTLDLIIIASVK